MPDLWFFGTLQHQPLRDVVLGQAHAVKQAVLRGHSACQSLDGQSAGLGHDPDAELIGELALGTAQDAQARLAFYARVVGWAAQSETLDDGTAVEIYQRPFNQMGQQPFDLAQWQSDWAAVVTEAALDVMSQFGTTSAEDLARQYPRILARSQSRVNAKSSRHGAGTLDGDVTTLDRRRAYANFYALDEFRLQHQTFSGTVSEPIDRGVFVTTDAALVLPYDPVTDRVLTVEQFRVGPLARGDVTVWQMEPVAGLVDPGETPRNTAIREAVEEAGIDIKALEPVAEGYTSPGGSTDFHYLYVGLCDLPEIGTRIGGLAEEGEDIRAHVMPFEQLLAMAEAQTLANSPLALATYWLAHHRARLRSG